MPWRHVKGLAWAELTLGPVVHPERHATVEHIAYVLDLTRVGAGDGPDVLGPPPTRLERAAADRVPVQVNQLDATLAVEKLAGLIR